MGWGGFGTLAEKLSTFLPGRIEKIKNERDRLNEEKIKLLNAKPFPAYANARIVDIDLRISAIKEILGNKASD